MTPTIPIGTLVRMTPRTQIKESAIEEHGYLWLVVEHDHGRHARKNVLKSIATGYTENFNTTGLEPFNEEQTDE
jgi:hypothetical protein